MSENVPPPQQAAGQRFNLGEFEGPLDLLLFLIRKNEVNIYDIPIAEITEQYLAYLQLATRVDLDNITEFYLMAATLIYIKSRMLLPVELDLDDDLEDPRRQLVEQLVEYQRYKKLSDLIARAQEDAEYTIERRREQIVLPFADDDLWENVAVWDLLKVFSHLISSISDERVFDLYEQVTVNEKITLIQEILSERSEFTFGELIGRGRRTPLEIVCSLLALLELIKSRMVIVQQNRMFGDIRVVKREGMDFSREAAIVEAVLYLEGEPMELAQLAHATGLGREAIAEALTVLRREYAGESHGLEVVEIGGAFGFAPKRAYWESLRDRYGRRNDKRLSRAALETLAIIAYTQPVTKAEVESIRGVTADGMIRLLLERGLVETAGKKDAPGRPVQYRTTREFLRVFRLASIADLPKMDELDEERFAAYE